MLPLGPEHGFLRLPEPARGDLFLDLEGDRLALDGGREYLFGVTRHARRLHAALGGEPGRGEARVRATWSIASSPRSARIPRMHVYHFGAYEPTAFKRLSGRYATRETELDTILRAELFVDLHTIVRHSLRASVETLLDRRISSSSTVSRASRICARRRRAGARSSGRSRCARIWEWRSRRRAAGGAKPQLELGLDASAARQSKFAEHIAVVERYNRDDCVSAARLRDWLEQLRAEAERAHGDELPRPELQLGRGERADRRGRPRKRSAS